MKISSGALMYDYTAMKRGEIFADADFVANIDRRNFWEGPGTNEKGEIVFDPLIPGAVYQFLNFDYEKDVIYVDKEFTVNSGETLDLGDITMKLEEEE